MLPKSHFNCWTSNITAGTSADINKTRLVIRDKDSLKEAIAAIDKNNEIKIPKVNFERKMALFVTSKTREKGGYETRIKKIVKDNEDLIIEIRDSEPGDTCINTQQLNIPMDLVVLDKVDLSIEFDVVKFVKECNYQKNFLTLISKKFQRGTVSGRGFLL